jgi:DNA-binding beta-propeller fold protein YncE
LLYPDDLAIGPDGNIYITDINGVTVISPQGTVLRRWGSQGAGPGQFRFIGPVGDPHSRIAIGSSGLVYVSDSGNDRVQVFTAGGRFVKQFGSDQLLSPDFLVVDGAGNTYIADDNGTTKFSPAGVLVWRIVPGVSSDPDLNHGILPGSLDSHGRLLGALPERDRVIYLDPDGHKVDAFVTGLLLIGGPCRVSVDALGNTYVTACGPNGNIPDFVGAQGADSLVFNREHKLVGDWRGAPHDALRTSPSFGPKGEVFALAWDALVELKITLKEQ